jgi:radical SAM superfamily enzyme YgiQ (UPF0313 family)
MLLIYPPSARSPEPPLGIARLAGFLRKEGREARCVDLCQEGIEFLLGLDCASDDTWTRGALRRRAISANALRDIASYDKPDLYSRAVGDLNRALRATSRSLGGRIEASLADYREFERTPLRKRDLIASAMDYGSNIFFPLFERRLGPELELEAAGEGVAGISICYLSQALCAFAIAGYIKAVAPGLRVVIGGGLVTSWIASGAIEPSESFGGFVDAALAGPGEEGLRLFLEMGPGSPGAAPDFDDFSRLGYFAPQRIVPYNFSSGCPWKRCSFCPERAEDMPYRGTPAPAAQSEIARLAERYKPGLFHFTDNEISPLYLRAMADRPPGAPWYGFARFSRRLLDRGLCEALSGSGCLMLQLGLESGDQDVLDALGKGTKVEEIARILDNLAAASICTYIYVLFGTPAEDREAALRTRDFIADRAELIGFLNIAVFNLPASGQEAKGLETGAFYEGDLSLYSQFRHPRGWDRNALREFLARDFESLPAIRTIMKRTPPVFTSSHAPFFVKAPSIQ